MGQVGAICVEHPLQRFLEQRANGQAAIRVTIPM